MLKKLLKGSKGSPNPVVGGFPPWGAGACWIWGKNCEGYAGECLEIV